MCESSFEPHVPKGVIESRKKFIYCVAHLPPEDAATVNDIMSPDTTDSCTQLETVNVENDRLNDTDHFRPIGK
ncbi:hypothetical protein CEXT_239501 [Caerostris extrusa]|uniref:DUF7041 domain-containing protein n=1 Tax=Caerostris extrusa TaxID=172846 RepID=A0AAV4XB77_CAEEX|nr:hypothetical protein CEXT_239501 [Caerostris extrusa]